MPARRRVASSKPFTGSEPWAVSAPVVPPLVVAPMGVVVAPAGNGAGAWGVVGGGWVGGDVGGGAPSSVMTTPTS